MLVEVHDVVFQKNSDISFKLLTSDLNIRSYAMQKVNFPLISLGKNEILSHNNIFLSGVTLNIIVCENVDTFH
jgi:hypothetical protein